MIVAMLVEDMLNELGHEVVGPAMRLEQALPLARNAELDWAILDINLNGVQSFPVADILRERGVPFVFATGYGTNGLLDAYRDTLTLKKPFQLQDLQRAFTETRDASTL